MNFVMTGLTMCPKLGEVVQICNSGILEVGEKKRLPQIQGQPGLHREVLSQTKDTQRSRVRYG